MFYLTLYIQDIFVSTSNQHNIFFFRTGVWTQAINMIGKCFTSEKFSQRDIKLLMRYFTLFWHSLESWCIIYICNASQFEAVFEILNSHLWLLVTTLDYVELNLDFEYVQGTLSRIMEEYLHRMRHKISCVWSLLFCEPFKLIHS